jgi:glucose-1-phosphate adenylyltransferase
VESYAEVEDSVIMEDVEIGQFSSIKRAIIDKGIVIPPKTEIGYDLKKDRKRFFVTESNLVVVSKGMKIV